MMKLGKLALDISEEEYRRIPLPSYSLLADYKRRGPRAVREHVEGKKEETRSLSMGTLVDKLLFGGEEALDTCFHVIGNLPPDSIKVILDLTHESVGSLYGNLEDVPDKHLLLSASATGYRKNWNDDTKIRKIREYADYYNQLKLMKGKTIVTPGDVEKAKMCVEVLRTNRFTKPYFPEESEDLEIVDQGKFVVNGLKCMCDRILVDHRNKRVQIIDLKTTSFDECMFHKSTKKFGYYIQAGLYTYVLETLMRSDPVLKGYMLEPFRFIVINPDNRTPYVYVWPYDSQTTPPRYDWRKPEHDVRMMLEKGIYDYTPEMYINNQIILDLDETED